MSKILKFVVHFVVLCTVICGLGLILPPFFGVQTQIMDDSSKATNLPMGSVTYAIPARADEVMVGTPILVNEDSRVYRYNIASLNLENGTGTVVDPTVSSGEPITVAVKEYVPKVVITIGLVGYLLIATESIEGLIILGLAVLFLIILYVIAELWKKDPQEEEQIDDPAPGYVKSKKELKREEKARARLLKEEEREIRNEDKYSKRKNKKEKRIVRTGGFVDEIEEDDVPEENASRRAKPAAMQSAASEAHEVLKKEIAAATAEEVPVAEAPKVVQDTKAVVNEVKAQLQAEEPAVEPAPASAAPEPEEEKPVIIKKLAMPVKSAAQLADAAKQAGDAPEIVKDDITKVMLFDYSDIIGNDGTPTEPER